jgi:hypothetical protein
MNCAVSISTAFALERLLREEGVARAVAAAPPEPPVDPACRPVWDALGRVQRRAPVVELLRAHRAARG